jgi:hypothetical protein
VRKSKQQATAEITHRRGVKPRRRPSGLYLPKARSRVTNGISLLPGIDQRSVWCRRFRDVLALHLADLGGPDEATAAEVSICRRIACLTVECERLEMLFAEAGGASDHKLECYQRACNTLNRLLRELGVHRRPSRETPLTVEEYLARKRRTKGHADVIEVEAET